MSPTLVEVIAYLSVSVAYPTKPGRLARSAVLTVSCRCRHRDHDRAALVIAVRHRREYAREATA
jgi:hypothetical protein